MSYKLEIKTSEDLGFISNAMRFQTESEAKAYEVDLLGRWYAIQESRVVASTDEVNYYWDWQNHKAKEIG